MFNKQIIDQPKIYIHILQEAFAKFVPCKSVLIKPTDKSWCNSFTHLLLRKKNRNYQFYKKCELDYQNILKQPNAAPELVTCLLNERIKAHNKTREAANDSSKANRRAKAAFHDHINNTLRNLVFCSN